MAVRGVRRTTRAVDGVAVRIATAASNWANDVRARVAAEMEDRENAASGMDVAETPNGETVGVATIAWARAAEVMVAEMTPDSETVGGVIEDGTARAAVRQAFAAATATVMAWAADEAVAVTVTLTGVAAAGATGETPAGMAARIDAIVAGIADSGVGAASATGPGGASAGGRDGDVRSSA